MEEHLDLTEFKNGVSRYTFGNKGRAYRRRMDRKVKNRMYRIMSCHSGYLKPYFWKTRKVGDNQWVRCNYIVSTNKDSDRKQFLKRVSNRAVRRSEELPSGKAGYKRCFDYWWELD